MTCANVIFEISLEGDSVRTLYTIVCLLIASRLGQAKAPRVPLLSEITLYCAPLSGVLCALRPACDECNLETARAKIN